MKQSGHFQHWMNRDAANWKPSPIELLTLATLHYLGRGWTFDDLEEATFINCETIRQFFHRFIDYGSTVLYNMHVIFPTTTEEAAEHMHEYMLAGLNGCFGSMDVTHVLVDMCRHNLRQMHMGFKMKSPARAYNLTANNRRRILHTTKGYPARWNDKTIIKFDTLVSSLQKGCTLGDVAFKLFEKNCEGGIVEKTYKGLWVLVDNGYLAWPTTMLPYMQPMLLSQQVWSKMVESMRKDVECTFKILKGHFHILKTGIRVHLLKALIKSGRLVVHFTIGFWKWMVLTKNLIKMALQVNGRDQWVTMTLMIFKHLLQL